MRVVENRNYFFANPQYKALYKQLVNSLKRVVARPLLVSSLIKFISYEIYKALLRLNSIPSWHTSQVNMCYYIIQINVEAYSHYNGRRRTFFCLGII